MPKTGKERQKEHAARMRANGYVQRNTWFSPEAQEGLRRIQEATGKGTTEAIAMALGMFANGVHADGERLVCVNDAPGASPRPGKGAEGLHQAEEIAAIQPGDQSREIVMAFGTPYRRMAIGAAKAFARAFLELGTEAPLRRVLKDKLAEQGVTYADDSQISHAKRRYMDLIRQLMREGL